MTRIEMNPKYESLRPFVERLPQVFDEQGEFVYGGRNLIKCFQAPDGLVLVVKRYHVPAMPNRLIYSLGIRAPKGRRAFDYPARLLSKGINTPEAIALIEERNAVGLLGYSYFVSVRCDYGHTLYEMGNARAEEYEVVAEAVGRYAAEIHEKDVLHRDFTPGNILWQRREDGGFDFCLVDINRMYFGPVSPKRGVRNITHLWGPKRFTQLLVRAYAEARSIDAEKAERLALETRRKFWTRYLKKHQVPFKIEL